MDHMGGMNNMGGYGTSIDTFVGGLLILLVKLLMVILVIAVIIGVGVWIKNAFFKNANTNKLIQVINNDPILKTVLVITIAVIGVIFLLALLGSFTGSSLILGSGMSEHGGMIGGYSSVLSIAGLLYLLIKALSFVLVVSLILALVAYIKKQADQGAFKFMKSNDQGTSGETNSSKKPEPGDNTGNL
ncbi:hypothetical protein [Pseudobacteroides cellulosolvens]|uniref:Uncharacterized protein n=1 Tax=Pseudobacteroides cellulosolvens ATCC 35603 = DSM 2933 TaxID=398512 RepID=A0A0L6JRP4_9FIRM|nr:hypothetical protein [Pseudobacteroides cellulosolvens]KNY28067.1 hypothetical protein Bccel_3338 [Pseudobacteroides cellulosolvens ATCC 35603 = DSM 2933]